MKSKPITLVETRRGCEMMESTPRFDVMFRGEKFDQLSFNMTGYVGYLPSVQPDGRVLNLNIGERGIGAYRKEVAALNKELAAKAKEMEQQS